MCSGNGVSRFCIVLCDSGFIAGCLLRIILRGLLLLQVPHTLRYALPCGAEARYPSRNRSCNPGRQRVCWALVCACVCMCDRPSFADVSFTFSNRQYCSGGVAVVSTVARRHRPMVVQCGVARPLHDRRGTVARRCFRPMASHGSTLCFATVASLLVAVFFFLGCCSCKFRGVCDAVAMRSASCEMTCHAGRQPAFPHETRVVAPGGKESVVCRRPSAEDGNTLWGKLHYAMQKP